MDASINPTELTTMAVAKFCLIIPMVFWDNPMTPGQGLRAPNIAEMNEEKYLYLRGQMWNATAPLTFQDLDKGLGSKFALPPKGLPVDNTIGFRVVLELDR